MMNKLSLQDLPLKGRRVLMRVDFNVPLNQDGSIADDARIVAALTSIQYILSQGASLVLMSHLGRPKGKKDPRLSLKVVADRLSTLIKKPVLMAEDCIGPATEKMAESLQPQEILLLENLRFHAAEEHPEIDPSFAVKLGKLGNLFVNDAFGTSHRKHASTYEVPKLFRGESATGFLVDKEIAFLGNVIETPKRPFFAMIGGAKISTKLGLIQNLIDKVDGLFIGGGMAYTFLRASGQKTGDSLVEEDQLSNAREIMKTAAAKAVKLWLPSDIIIADAFAETAKTQIISGKDPIPDGWQGMAVGPKTCSDWQEALTSAQTIFWNGPLGAFELPPFAATTFEMASFLAASPATTIVGGGDSVSAINQLGLAGQFTHISTGGGASLELIELGHLPSIDILTDR
ncbi:MAG: phosphoglycerate kinase [Chlamydiota bacterium]